MNKTKRESLRLIAQENKRWSKFRSFKVTSSNAYRFLHKSTDIKELLLGNEGGDDCSMNYLLEKVIKFVLAKIVFNTGIWVDLELFWLSTSPDGMTVVDDNLVPVEIKVITANKTNRQVIIEYYGQIQLHMRVTNSQKLLLVIFFKANKRFECFLVERDDNFLNEFLKRIEICYFKTLPMVLIENCETRLIDDLVNSNVYKQFCLKLNKSDSNWESKFEAKIPKKVKFTKHLIKDKELTRISKKSPHKIEEEYEKINSKRFQKKFHQMFVFEKVFWFQEKIARFLDAQKLVTDAEWSS